MMALIVFQRSTLNANRQTERNSEEMKAKPLAAMLLILAALTSTLMISLPSLVSAGPRTSPAYVCPARYYYQTPFCDCEAGCECVFDSCLRQCPPEDLFQRTCGGRCQDDYASCYEGCSNLYGAEYCGEFN